MRSMETVKALSCFASLLLLPRILVLRQTNAFDVHWKTLKHWRHYNLLLLLLLLLIPRPASLLRSLSFSVACLNAAAGLRALQLHKRKKERVSRSGCVISILGSSAVTESPHVPFEYSLLVVVVRPFFCVCSPSTSQQFRHLSFSFCIRAPLYVQSTLHSTHIIIMSAYACILVSLLGCL